MCESEKIKNQVEKLKIYEEKKYTRCQNLKDLIRKCSLQNKVEIGLLSIEPKIDIDKKTVTSFKTKLKKF